MFQPYLVVIECGTFDGFPIPEAGSEQPPSMTQFYVFGGIARNVVEDVDDVFVRFPTQRLPRPGAMLVGAVQVDAGESLVVIRHG